ncbi:MAG: O-antigen ligase family protein [Candidatus Omnitrophica bacterium]|nr:O-antigen ligase family protein [Candidatus Omnitrophota bacterium]MDD5591842.1 O-antigen ligase family protein [Candidatus Omnitrophota bacterium]
MTWEKSRIVDICDKVALSSLYAIALLFPVSKAAIEVFSTLAILCYIVKKITQRKGISVTPLNLAILTYLAICFISIFISSNPKISTRTFFGKTIQDILFFFVLVDTLNNEKRLKNFIYIFFFSSAVLGIDGIYQNFTRKDFIRHRPTIFVDRIYATFPTPNDFGCYLNAIIPFLITVFFARSRAKTARFFLSGLFALLFICLILTVSRGAWFGFMASALFIGVWIYPVGIFLLLLGLFIIVTQPFYPTLIKNRLNNFLLVFDITLLGDVGSIERKIFWQAGWKMFMYNPWIGLGLGTFMFNFKRFVVESYQYGPSYAHNCYLQILSEIGIIGLVSFLAILVLFFYNGIKTVIEQQKTFSWYILLASLAALLGYSVQMAVDTIFYSLDLGLLFWILLGLGAAAMNNIKLETDTKIG